MPTIVAAAVAAREHDAAHAPLVLAREDVGKRCVPA
jgi:hypothetical protein